MEGGRLVLARREDVPEVGQVHDRELEALRAVDREHLDGQMVGLQAARAALVLVAGARLGDAAAQPGRQRGRPEAVGGARTVQQLGDMAEVGQRPLATGGAEDPCRQILADRDRLGQRGHALRAQHARPAVEAAMDVLEVGRRGSRQALARPSRGTA